MSLPKIFKKIDDRVIRPTSTYDNALTRFDGTSGQIQNSSLDISDNGVITVPTDSGQFKKVFNSSSNNAALLVGSNNSDVPIWRVWSSNNDYSDYGSFGYDLKYEGTFGGVDNYLTLFADNKSASVQNIAYSFNQNGEMAIRGRTVEGYSLRIYGKTFTDNSITLTQGKNVFDPVGLIFGETGRIGSASEDLGLYSTGRIYLRGGCDYNSNSYNSGLLLTSTTLQSLGEINLGDSSHKFKNLWLSNNINLCGNITIDASDNVDRYFIFDSGDSNGYSWRIGYLGTGTDEKNYFVIQSNGKDAAWANIIRCGLISHEVQFTGDISILTGNTDKFITWRYSNEDDQRGASWRIGMLGTGSSNSNYLVFQTTDSSTSTSETWTNAIRIGMNNRDIQINGPMNNVVNTDYSTVKFRGTAAGTGSAPSSLNNGEVYMKY